jgi:hypothetical protein
LKDASSKVEDTSSAVVLAKRKIEKLGPKLEEEAVNIKKVAHLNSSP